MKYPVIVFFLTAALAVNICFWIYAAVKKRSPRNIAEAVSSAALMTMGEAVIILNGKYEYLYCNNSAKALFPELEKYPITGPVTKAGWWPPELQIESRPDESSEIIFKNGESIYKSDINKIMDERGRPLGWDIVIHDITGVTSRISQLESLATTDSLTGIATRRHFLDRVTRELDMAARLSLTTALIMYDIDFFKNVNDTYGHAAGDYILCAVVEVVKQQLRSYDIFARYGGEEFVIFTLSSDDEDSLNKFASRLRKAVEAAEFVYEKKNIPVTASFGAVQIFPGDNFNGAMLAVDEAMYKAKNSGRNQVIVGKIKKDGQEPSGQGA